MVQELSGLATVILPVQKHEQNTYTQGESGTPNTTIIMANQIKPIPAPKIDHKNLATLPPLSYGAGALRTCYGDLTGTDVPQVVKRALSLGVHAFDTSPYYDNSEEILGDALEKCSKEYPRESYFIATKCGRIKEEIFDYSAEGVRKSVERSLQRLKTDYIDILFLHDVEFVEEKEVLEAARELFRFKDSGKVLHVGISGLPLGKLEDLAKKIKEDNKRPLDVIMSYSHFTIHNSTLAAFAERLKASGLVSTVLTASPLSMGLLRKDDPPYWHPASDELKKAVKRSSDAVEREFSGEKLADVALRFSFSHWSGTCVVGMSSIRDVEDAVKNWWLAKEKMEEDKEKVALVKKELGEHLDTIWEQPPAGWKRQFPSKE
eukprot:TRINITY_DN5170_c0_g1_i1.p1 TRINITY_DN5170_c0_g1~~TRINITY_DN5170_c0_g1_i1.p1  ORF type:complete len:376 (+),score=106.52 TRINITY_DN5170_c0_g1_i1:161-1288(+)